VLSVGIFDRMPSTGLHTVILVPEFRPKPFLLLMPVTMNDRSGDVTISAKTGEVVTLSLLRRTSRQQLT
jgi:hypothetical protein